MGYSITGLETTYHIKILSQVKQHLYSVSHREQIEERRKSQKHVSHIKPSMLPAALVH